MPIRKIEKLIEHCIWYLLMLLPLISFVIYIVHHDITFNEYIVDNFGVLSSNFLYSALNQLFGDNSSYLPTFISDGIMHYVTYIFTINLIHIVFDFFMFLPRVVSSFCEKINGGD